MHFRLMCPLWVAVALVSAGCGDSKSSLTPTSPTAASIDAATAADASGTSGTMHHRPGHTNGGGNGNGNGNQPPTNTSPGPTAPTPPGKSKVEFEGLLESVGANSILVNGQVVMVTADTVIRHGNTMYSLSELSFGDRVHVRAARVPAPPGASIATLVAELILRQNPDEDSVGETDCLVSVRATDPTATETPMTTGTFTLTRTGTPAQLLLPLPVSYTLDGSATINVDYTIPATTSFASNQTTITVVVTPIADALVEAPEAVVLTLASTGVAPCEAGSPNTATVSVSDAVVPEISVAVSDATATEAGDEGSFTLTRTGDPSAALTVTIQITGVATSGVDYTLLPATAAAVPATVTFAAGSPTAIVRVTPQPDAATDPSETVILTVVDGPDYNLGAAPSATLTITGT